MKQVYQLNKDEISDLMIHYTHSTLHTYYKSITVKESMSINDFRNINRPVIESIYNEVKTKYGYELSYEEMSKAINRFFVSEFNPLSVSEELNNQISYK